MRLFGHLRLSLWIGALGAIVLYVFFVSLASIPPGEVAGTTAVVAVLAAMITIRNLRLGGELGDPGGDPGLRRALNRQRERRGF